MYQNMQYRDEDQAGWGPEERDFGAAWRRQPKWVVSRTLKSVGPNARLVSGDAKVVVRGLETSHSGEIDVSGTVIAQSLTDLGLIDEYCLDYPPVMPGRGKPLFADPTPPLRLTASETFDERAIRLTYEPARSAARTSPMASPAQLR
jgi:dihydrofolate reductase